jgi:uncharacterized membrane protein
MSALKSFILKNQKYIPYVILIVSLIAAALIRWRFTSLHANRFFGLSFTDIANTHSRFLGSASRIPYINFDLEYPVVLGAFFYLMGLIGAKSLPVFFFANSFFMSLCAVISLGIMQKIHKLTSGSEFMKRAIIFWSLAPSIFLFTTYNWDHLAILFMLLAIYLLFKEKFLVAMVFLCLGAFTKMFPGFLLVPFLIYIYRSRGLKSSIMSGVTFLATALSINLPLIIYRLPAWLYFFKFSSERGAFADNIWSIFFVLSNRISFMGGLNWVRIVSFSSLGLFAILYIYINWRYWHSKKEVFLQTCFLSILAYLITAKTTSAPFNLWILPFFVLIPVNLWFGLAAEWANAFVFYAFFQHIYYNDFLGLSISPGHYFRLTYLGVLIREGALMVVGLNYLKRMGWLSRISNVKAQSSNK